MEERGAGLEPVDLDRAGNLQSNAGSESTAPDGCNGDRCKGYSCKGDSGKWWFPIEGNLIRLSLLGTLVSLANLLPTFSWLQEICINFGSYFLFAHLTVLVHLAVRFSRYRSLWRWRRAVSWQVVGYGGVQVALLLFYAGAILPFYLDNSAPPYSLFPPATTAGADRGFQFKIITSNIYGPNEQLAELKVALQSYAPDLLAVQEATPRGIEALGLAASYPYTVQILREDNFGLALFSKFPLAAAPNSDFAGLNPPTILTEITLPNGYVLPICVVHSQPPQSQSAYIDDRLLFRRISTIVRHDQRGFIVLGDFNATPYSELYRYLTVGGELYDAGWGQGWWRTWNANIPIFRLALDHIFYRGPLAVRSAAPVDLPGSDHFGVQVEFEVK